jgi:hypothetical protein
VRELKEAEIQTAIMQFLRLKKFLVFKHRNVGIYKKNTDRYNPLPASERGIADIIACAPNGQFWAIEVKTPKGRVTDEQLEFLGAVRQKGGVGILARSVDDVINQFQ